MNYKFLIFDLDGTIVDSQKDITTAVNGVRKELGFDPLSVSEIRSFLGSGIKALINKAVPKQQDEYKHALERFRDYYSKCLIDTTLPYNGVIEMLESLKDKKKAILSNKTESFSVEIIERLNLSKYFIAVWGGDTAGVKKPDPKPILDLIKIAGVSKSEAIMIGDSENDFKAAQAAGIDSIAVLYGYSEKKQIELLKPTYIVSSPKEIINIVGN